MPHQVSSGDQPIEITQYRLSIRKSQVSDHRYAHGLATTPPRWWPQWLPWIFGCKSYTVLLVGNDTPFAEKHTDRRTFRSVIGQDPAHIDMIVFEEEAEDLKKQGIHISGLAFYPYQLEGSEESRIYGTFTITIYGH